MPKITILYANHWPEIVPVMEEHLQSCHALVTEDAPSAEFEQMLAGDLAVDDYLLATDIEYPEFGRRMCRLWRRLKQAGMAIVPVEPFIAELIAIHTHLADGGTPGEIAAGTRRRRVYEAERLATGALLDFYQTASTGDFDAVVEAIQRFARLDGQRFVLRDQLRAEAIGALLPAYPRIAVEAGQIHLALPRFLRQQMPPKDKLQTIFLMRIIAGRLGRRHHVFPPGDLLTLLYIFHPAVEDFRHRLLAARALIYSKVAAKEETGPDQALYSRTRDDLRSIGLVNRLSLQDCRHLFEMVRHATSARSRAIVADYLKRS